MPKPRRARVKGFTAKENRALQDALVTMSSGLTQARIGEIIGCNQQNAGRLLKHAGFAYGTALRLVRHLGFQGLDSFFATKGLAPEVIHLKAG